MSRALTQSMGHWPEPWPIHFLSVWRFQSVTRFSDSGVTPLQAARGGGGGPAAGVRLQDPAGVAFARGEGARREAASGTAGRSSASRFSPNANEAYNV